MRLPRLHKAICLDRRSAAVAAQRSARARAHAARGGRDCSGLGSVSPCNHVTGSSSAARPPSKKSLVPPRRRPQARAQDALAVAQECGCGDVSATRPASLWQQAVHILHPRDTRGGPGSVVSRCRGRPTHPRRDRGASPQPSVRCFPLLELEPPPGCRATTPPLPTASPRGPPSALCGAHPDAVRARRARTKTPALPPEPNPAHLYLCHVAWPC